MEKRSMSQIFISYRREEAAGHAGRLHDLLVEYFGRDKVFRDVDNIPPGTDFVKAIEEAIRNSAVLVLLIGPRWLVAADVSGRRRLDDPGDFVRLEIAAALAGGVPVLPVLLGEVPMPTPGDLPAELAGLSRWQALRISEDRFGYDFGRLAKAIQKYVPISRRWGGFNLAEECPVCHEQLPVVRTPRSLKQLLLGGWDCQNCGTRLDRHGRVV